MCLLKESYDFLKNIIEFLRNPVISFKKYGSVRLIRLQNWGNSGWFFRGEKSTSEGGSGTVWGRLSPSRLGTARLGLVRLGLAQIGAARPSSARLGSGPARPRSDLDRLGLARLSSARFGLARLGSARLGLAQPGPGSDQLGRARLEVVWGLFKLFSPLFPDGGWEGKKCIIRCKNCCF